MSLFGLLDYDRDSFRQLLDEDVGCGWSTRLRWLLWTLFQVGAIWSKAFGPACFDMDR